MTFSAPHGPPMGKSVGRTFPLWAAFSHGAARASRAVRRMRERLAESGQVEGLRGPYLCCSKSSSRASSFSSALVMPGAGHLPTVGLSFPTD